MAIIQDIFRHMGGDGDLYAYIRKEYKTRAQLVAEGIKQYDPDLHDVANKSKRPDKVIFVPTGEKDENGNDVLTTDTSQVSRAPIAIQKYIIEQKASFDYGSGVELKPTNPDSPIWDDVWRNWDDGKFEYSLSDIDKRMMSETQVAIIFYSEPDGVESLNDFRFKLKVVSPEKGDKLEPIYDDETGDLIAFGREYKIKRKKRYDLYVIGENGFVEIHRYEGGILMTRESIIVDEEDMETTSEVPDIIYTTYTKLPIVYWEQDAPECHDTRELIRELEWSFNDFLTQQGYTGDPILFLSGMTMDLPAKGQQGKVIENPDGQGDAKFLEQDGAPEARQMQFDMLMKFIFMINRAATLDVGTLKELTVESGEALQRMLTDVYAAAEDRQMGAWGLGVQRMVNWLLHEWKALRNAEKEDLRIKVKFTRKSLRGESERIDLAQKANGGQAVATLATTVEMAGLEDDVNEAVEAIKSEQGNSSVTE